MGLDIAYILPTKLRSLRNHAECVRCLNETVSQAERYFHGKKHFVSGIYVERENEDLLREFSADELSGYAFYVPFLAGCDFWLYAGFWGVTNGFRYWQYFCKKRDAHGHWRCYLREIFFDAARMLGRSEGWLCSDLTMDNFCDIQDDAFTAWLYDGDEQPQEFQLKDALDVNDHGFPDYEDKYHDVFKECFELLEEYQVRFPNYEILTIHPICNCILVAEGDDIRLLNPDTCAFLVPFPIDGIKEYNDDYVTIYRGDQYAKFNHYGNQLTPFQ